MPSQRLAPSDLPDWPLGLSEPLAAAYIGLSASLFREMIADGKAPPAVRLSEGRVVWHRDVLKDWLDGKAGLKQPPTRSKKSNAAPAIDWD